MKPEISQTFLLLFLLVLFFSFKFASINLWLDNMSRMNHQSEDVEENPFNAQLFHCANFQQSNSRLASEKTCCFSWNFRRHRRIEWKFLAHKFCTLSIHVLQNLFWWVPRYGLLIDIANTSSQLHTTVFHPGAYKILLRYIHVAAYVYDMIYQV